MTQTLPRRGEVPREDQWNLQSIFPSEDAFEQAFARAESTLPGLARYVGTLASSAGQLLAALQARDEATVSMGKIVMYAILLRAVDQTDEANIARADRAMGLSARLEAAISFYAPELLALTPQTLVQFAEQEPGLAPYAHHLETLGLLRGHVRSAEVEQVLAQASDVTSSPRTIHGALENADLRFASVPAAEGAMELNPGNSAALIASDLRSRRKAAWQSYADGYLSVKNTMAATLAANIKGNVFYARAHRYGSAREASMSPHNLPLVVFDNLIATVRAHLPLWHRYWAIRQRALGVSRLHPYDLHVPLATATERITFERAVEMMLEGLAPLGDEYTSVLRRGMTEERWVDKYPNLGKQGGAFAGGLPGTSPFIMHNYDNSLGGLSVLAHEAGHAMHSYFSCRHQPPLYASYSMFVAETASNFNQALLRAHLLRESDDRRFKVAVIEEGMANFHRYFFIMPILAQFELQAHERVERGQALTADSMSAQMVGLYGEGYGGTVQIDAPRVGITWAQFPHLFMNFYVYQYATGISAANALAAGVLTGGKPAAERYLELLKAGDSLYPLDALKLAGVDMATPEPIEAAFGVLEGLVNELDTLVGAGPLPWLPQPDC